MKKTYTFLVLLAILLYISPLNAPLKGQIIGGVGSAGSGSGTVNNGNNNTIATYSGTGTTVAGSHYIPAGATVDRTYTFPDANMTVARSDAAQTLTGSQTLTAVLLTNGSGIDIGSTSAPFRDLYLYGSGTYSTTYIRLTGTPTNTRVITFPDASITVARNDAAQTFTGDQKFGATTGTMTTDTAGSTVTFNLASSNLHTTTLGVGSGAGNTTLALSNDASGKVFTVVLVQDGTGSRTVTWWNNIKWAAGTTPTLTTTINKADVFTFIEYSAANYYGTVDGQNF